jgi:acyl carrier protein
VPLEKITSATRQAVFDLLEEKLKRPLTDDEKKPATLLENLGLDSLDRMDLAQTIEQRFGFRSDQVATTVGELGALAQGLVEAARASPSKVRPENLDRAARRTRSRLLRPRADHPRSLRAPGPRASGRGRRRGRSLRRRHLLADAHRRAPHVQTLCRALPGDAVGLMLPASVAADTAFLALLWARKLPVLLNWTTGPVNLNHAAKVMRIQRVITSRKFIDRSAWKSKASNTSSWKMFARASENPKPSPRFSANRLFPGKVLASLPRVEPNDIAVVLFTSGSEKAPKAVPLTHRNIMTDVQAGASALGFKRGDILLGFLPPFHSFGLSGNIVLPLVGRRARRPSCRSHRRGRPRPQDRRLPAHAPPHHADLFQLHPQRGQTGRPRLAPHRRHRRGEMSRRPLRPREGNHAARDPLRRLRHHRMRPRRLGQPSRQPAPRHHRPAARRRGSARRRSRLDAAAAQSASAACSSSTARPFFPAISITTAPAPFTSTTANAGTSPAISPASMRKASSILPDASSASSRRAAK